MKYFSPSVLDGSITTAKLADLAVTNAKLAGAAVNAAKIQLFTINADRLAPQAVPQGKIKNSSTSQAGSISGGLTATVSLSAFSFFPDIEVQDVANEQPLLVIIKVTPSATADSPQFEIKNSAGSPKNYSVAWRRVDA